MHIAVCIQNKETSTLLSHLLEMYQEKHVYTLYNHLFKNSTDLLCSLTGGEYDVIFFDDSHNNRLAQEIREKDRRARLVRITGLTSAVQGDSDIWHCLPAPPSSAFLFPLLDQLRIVERKHDEDAALLIKSRGCVMLLPFSHLEYVEVMGRSVFFHLTDQTTEEASGSFAEFEARLLHFPDFIKVHRSYIINLRHVQKLEISSILTTGGHSVPVSRKLYPQFKKDYLCRLMDPGAKTDDVNIDPSDIESGKSDGFSVLLVDDETEQRLRWANVLTVHGCKVKLAHNGETALALTVQKRFDCVILDVKLGSECGFDLCSALTKQTGAPVVFLSSMDDSKSQIQGFLSGGIDYITKDATDALFWLKIETRIKMAKAAKTELLDGSLLLNLKERKTFLEGQEVPLTTVEFDLLSLLMRNPGVVYTPKRLYEATWGTRRPDNGQTVQLHLSLLERKLYSIFSGHSFIETVWGKGYRFVSTTARREKFETKR